MYFAISKIPSITAFFPKGFPKGPLPLFVEFGCTIQKMKFSIKDFFSKGPNLQCPADLVAFTEESLNGKPHFLCSDMVTGICDP